ncbi:MAG: hypothetical protein AAB618_01640 [Patescibacteria group bacterium]
MSFFGKKSFFSEQELLPSDEGSVQSAETVLAAAKRVHQRFGVKTEADKLAQAIKVAQSRDQAATAFAAANISILDTAEVQAYQTKQILPTWWQRLKNWNQRVIAFFDRTLAHDIVYVVVAFAGLLLTLPLALCWGIDSLWYDVNYITSWMLIVGLQTAGLLFIFCGVVIIAVREDEEIEEFVNQSLRFYVNVNMAIIGLPARLIASLVGIWFYRGTSVKRWTTMSVNQYHKSLPDSVVLSIDHVMGALPKAQIELEVLEPATDGSNEMFVTLKLGAKQDKLYLWHEPALE